MRWSIAVPFLFILVHAGCTAVPAAHPPSAVASAAASRSIEPPSASASPSVAPTAAPSATPDPGVQAGVPSEAGLYVGAWTSVPGVPPINELHEWMLHIETADGMPVEGAAVSVDGDMPAHGHGMPTEPEVTADLGGGDYRVEGMSFQMGGYWIIDVTVTTDAGTDLIRFGLDLDL